MNVRMNSANSTFGFEIFQKLHHNEIQKKEDVIILLLHWYLVKSGLRCIGIGDDTAFNASDKGSELLPERWNTYPNYTIRYIKDKKLYILSGIKSDAELLLNLVKFEDDIISNIHFPIDETVSALHGPLETIIPSYQMILHNVQKDLIDPIIPNKNANKGTNEAATQTSTYGTGNVHVLSDPMMQPRGISGPSISRPCPEQDPAAVGAADLYPGRPGGGMIFNPFQNRQPQVPGLGIPGRLPPGAIPPGARFDPYGPPDVDLSRPSRRYQTGDELPPPGFHDDMFL